MIKYDKGITREVPDEFPAEFPIKLTVNGRNIATLVSSPHELRFLVAGFLRTQGFVQEVSDILVLGVCDDSGEANIRIRGELPERLTPVLTSGCGTGITFSFNAGLPKVSAPNVRFTPDSIFAMMQELSHLSERYGRHGGIHSAAVSDGTRILFHAEDLGRHNTIDRLAGKALLSGTDLAGSMLLTSGRVSTEMAAKAASLGIALIASRTSPTDMAVRICQDAGIGLVGYVRGESFRIAACPERLRMATPQQHCTGVAGVILAGGESSRMGRNKALLEINGERMIETIYRRMSELFDEVLLVSNSPEMYDFIPCRKITDIYPGMGPLGGIHAALSGAAADRIFVTACDMPDLDSRLIRELCTIPSGADVIVPETPDGREPLHAVYAKSGLPRMEKMLRGGERSVLSFIDRAKAALVPRAQIATLDPDYASFHNINTLDDFQKRAELTDSYGRTINYLRLSVTDRCNMRCFYCMPPEGIAKKEHSSILTYEELLLIAETAVGLGIEKVRITGGEPLVRTGIISFLERLAQIPGLRHLALTTNGVLLAELAESLRHAGVQRLNVSLDSLNPRTFSEITRGGDLNKVKAGLDAAEKAGFPPPKINCVIMRGVNDGEILDFAEMTVKRGNSIRFIEYMPAVKEEGWQRYCISGSEILERIADRHPLEQLVRSAFAGPSRDYWIPGAKGSIGIITAISGHFCSDCNRIRVTSTGQAKGCLFSDERIDLVPALRPPDRKHLAAMLQGIVATKPERHGITHEGYSHHNFTMAQVGG